MRRETGGYMAQIERLNKYMAESGVASRRNCDDIITSGRVKVNGKAVTELGVKIAPFNDTVTVDDIIIKPRDKDVVIMLNKPKGCLTTLSDDRGRKTVMDYIDLSLPRLFPIGRLDYDTEGLLLLTNNGDLANKIAHPSLEIPKTYRARVEGELPEHMLAQLRKGVIIDGEKTRRAKLKLLEFKDGISTVDVTITEGRNRQVRKMFETVERNVIFLKRIAVGELRLGGLGRGAYRYLNDAELEYLKRI